MDLDINIRGNASGAVSALNESGGAAVDAGESAAKSAVKWQMLADAASTAARAALKFGVDSVKAYAESERVQMQLVRASGKYADALDEQAKALSKLYAVDDDVIKQSQILLTQWGGVGAATKEVETAALDLAAAMGGDLNSATQDLIRNVESGGAGLAKMGIHFKTTGDKGKDLSAAVAAISAKLGGSAGADAGSLIGRTHAAQLAFEDLQKSIGGMLATSLDKSGALEFITEKIRQMTKGLEVAFAVMSKLPGMAGGVLRGNIAPGTAMDEIKNTAMDAFLGGNVEKLALPGVTGQTNKSMKGGGSDAAQAATDAAKEVADVRKAMAEDDARDQKAFQKAELSAQDDYAKESIKIEKARLEEIKKSTEDVNKWLAAVNKEEAASELKAQKDAARREEQTLKEQNERVTKKAHEAKAAGDAIGAAMVNALADQLSKLAEGGEFDAAAFISEILAAAVGIAGTVIGTAFGQPAVGAAIGNIAAMGIRAGGSAISKGGKSNAPRTMHSGGWVGDEVDIPRHHSGAWIGSDERRAILQTGERVLSRAEVSRAGGAAGVDGMASGQAGGRPVYIQAIDSKSMADTLSDRGGDGFKQALRRGQGALPMLFGRGPR